jgi:hypothetical protein
MSPSAPLELTSRSRRPSSWAVVAPKTHIMPSTFTANRIKGGHHKQDLNHQVTVFAKAEADGRCNKSTVNASTILHKSSDRTQETISKIPSIHSGCQTWLPEQKMTVVAI